MYSCSPTFSQISLKNSFGKGFFFQILAEIERREIKIGYLAAILKRYNIFIFFFRIVIFYSPYIMVQISLRNSSGNIVFFTPLGHQRE